MLCYCVDELEYFKDDLINIEDITGTNELLAELLIKSFDIVYRNGYLKQYKKETIVTTKPHGRINVAKSISTGAYFQGKMVCDVNKLDINNKLNQIIKSTFEYLIRLNKTSEDKISDNTISRLYFCMDKLKGVDTLPLSNRLLCERLDIPRWYRPVIAICKLIIENKIALDTNGSISLFSESTSDRLKYIFEKFVRNFYKKECKQYQVTRPHIDKMGRTRIFDMMLYNKENDSYLVIDTKYYEKTSRTTSNDDQINTYTSEIKSKNTDSKVSGLLLYACGDNTREEYSEMQKGGYQLAVWYLSINQDIESLKSDLITLAEKYLD